MIFREDTHEDNIQVKQSKDLNIGYHKCSFQHRNPNSSQLKPLKETKPTRYKPTDNIGKVEKHKRGVIN